MSESENSPSHASPAPVDAVVVPEPSLAERARSLVQQGGHATLSTISAKHPGYPFGSLMPYGLTDGGSPTFLISSMAMHTKNVQRDPRATLLIVQSTDDNPLGAGRISLMGDVLPIDESERERVSEAYLARNPAAVNWVKFGDFQFFQMQLIDIYFVGGFGVMGWIETGDYSTALPDPLLESASAIIQHMNEDHRDAMATMVEHQRQIEAVDAEMTSVDRLGFHLRVTTPNGMKGVRLAFPQPVNQAAEVRAAMVQMVQSARGGRS